MRVLIKDLQKESRHEFSGSPEQVEDEIRAMFPHMSPGANDLPDLLQEIGRQTFYEVLIGRETPGPVAKSEPDDQLAKALLSEEHTQGYDKFNTTPEQKDLIHGVQTKGMSPLSDLGEYTTQHAGFMDHPAGGQVFYKPDRGGGTAHHEVLYHNIARDYFKLGDHVPTTAIGHHPRLGTFSMQKVQAPTLETYKNKQVKQILKKISDDGTTHKLAMMDYVLGHKDRHAGNMLLTEHEPHLHLIDNASILGSDEGVGEGSQTPPVYLSPSAVMTNDEASNYPKELNVPIHPNAVEWAKKLRPDLLASELQKYRVDPEEAEKAVERLKTIQSLPQNSLLTQMYYAQYHKTESNLHDEWADAEALAALAQKMVGGNMAGSKLFEAARFLSGRPRVSEEEARRSLILHDTDREYAALHVYGLPLDASTREALRSISQTRALSKGEGENPGPRIVVPGTDDARASAASLERAFGSGAARNVDLQGRHSHDAEIARDPQTGRSFLIKYDSGGQSPALGVTEEKATQPRREAAFWHIADHCDQGSAYPRADFVIIGSDEAVAMTLLPNDFKNLEDLREKEGINEIQRILAPYAKNGQMHRWAALDYVCGNPDRHAGNLMLKGDSVVLIDQGSAFAGSSFNPATDKNSFIPFYLRAWHYKEFADASPRERYKQMPHLDAKSEKILKVWVDGISPQAVERILNNYGINPKPTMDRLEILKEAPVKYEFLNKFFSGDQ